MYVELTPEDERIIKSYADVAGVSSEEIVRRAVREYIDESEDDPELDRAIARYKTNPVTYSMEDVKKRYGLRCRILSDSRILLSSSSMVSINQRERRSTNGSMVI